MTTKRIFDLCFTTLGLIVLSPLFVVIAIWIKLDSPGTVFFKQIRVGQFGHEFNIYKFRTMVANAESLGSQLTVENDRRITRSGQFLRKYKLDELPQLFNVLKGDMSLVGPRPEVSKYVALYSPEQFQILNARPGITDLASIEFRNESQLLDGKVNFEEIYVQEIMPRKLELNRQYITQVGLFFDLQIIFQTVWRLLAN